MELLNRDYPYLSHQLSARKSFNETLIRVAKERDIIDRPAVAIAIKNLEIIAEMETKK